MEGFIKYSPIERSVPRESGAYNVIIVARRGVPVIDVMFYSVENNKWVRQFIDEAGYSSESVVLPDHISHFKRIEGVKFNIIPESYFIEIGGYIEEDDD